MKEDIEPQLSELKRQNDELLSRIDKLENTIKNHIHTGNDGTTQLQDTSQNLLGKGEFRIGNKFLVTGGREGASRTTLSVVGGELNKSLANSFLPSIGIYSGTTLEDFNQLSQLGTYYVPGTISSSFTTIGNIIAGPNDDGVSYFGEDGKFGQISLVTRQKSVGSYLELLASPIESSINVSYPTATAGTETTITDTSKNWVSNIFANSFLSLTAGSTVVIRKITSNTSNTITFSPALPAGITGSTLSYIFSAVLVGARFSPIAGVRIVPGGSIVGMGSGGNGFLMVDPFNDASAPAGATSKYVYVQIDGELYGFQVTKIS